MNLNISRPHCLALMPAALLMAAGFCLASPAAAQIRIEMPEMPEIRGGVMDMGVLMDGAMFSSGSNSSVSMTIENGVKKITASENGVKTYIEEGEGGIIVKVTRRYGPEQMDILEEEHPGLYMAMKDFPTEVDDAEEVEVSVGVTKKYEAANAEELKENHPEIFKTYEKYSNGNSGALRLFRGRLGGDMLIPELRITPEIRGIIPDDIRIHDDEDKGEDKGEEKAEKNSDDKDT